MQCQLHSTHMVLMVFNQASNNAQGEGQSVSVLGVDMPLSACSACPLTVTFRFCVFRGLFWLLSGVWARFPSSLNPVLASSSCHHRPLSIATQIAQQHSSFEPAGENNCWRPRTCALSTLTLELLPFVCFTAHP
jgi:hypothetical protein